MRAILAPTPTTPMAYLFGDGDMARSIAPLLQGLLIVSLLVVAIVSILVIVGVLRRRSTVVLVDTPIADRPAVVWIGVGVGLSTVVLVGFIVWSTVTMARIARPPQAAAFTIAITA
ncbi:MAG: cytochrome C, partial [Hyphomicrobiales bacterium]|nr:cytochrome C [Hyphomicrobiales bacterium]